MFVEKFASNMGFTDSKRLGTWGLCVMVGMPRVCTRNAVWCEFIASLSTAHDGRATHRPVLKTRLPCWQGVMMPDIIVARTKTAETATVLMEQ